RLLGRGGRLGSDVGRLRAVGLRTVPLWPLGVRGRALGLVSRRICQAAIVGAGIGRMGGRLRLELVGDRRRAGVGMGSAGVGGAVSAMVGTLLERLLGPL